MDTSKLNQSIVLFDVEGMRYSNRWGSSFGAWYDAYEPSTTIAFYSNAHSEKTIKILSENNIELNTIDVKADKGFNYVKYDITMTDEGRTALMKENPDLDIKKAKNDKYYLPKGKYSVQIDGEKTTLDLK